jgi:ubiquinone biosynthesis protein
MTMERLTGISVASPDRLQEQGIELRGFTERFTKMFIDMIFRDGFYHADPHPGNIWALPGDIVGLLDCGMVGRLDTRTREEVENLLLALLQNDPERLTDTVLRIGLVPRSLDRRSLQADIEEYVAEYFGHGSIKDFDMSGALNELTAIIRNYHIILPSNISSFIKVLIMLEGTARGLNPEFQLLVFLEPYQAEAVQRRFAPEKLLHRLQRSFRDWERLLDMLPRQLAAILEGIQSGELDVHLDIRRLDPIINRIVSGILIAALFTGSCRVLSQGIPPLIGGFSAFGAGGCVLALGLGYRLFRTIKKSGDLGQK